VIEASPELLESLRDESERPTIRLPARPPFAPDDDPERAPNREPDDKTVRRRVVVGPDGVPRMIDPDETEETTRPYLPSKMLLGRGKAGRKR
jgi:hypothetical protein